MKINVARARRCLDCAEFAYLDMGTKNGQGSPLDHALKGAGLALINIYDRGDTQAFLAAAGGDLYLSNRGTKSAGDWFTDLNYVKQDFHGGGRVHQGFYRQFLAIEPLILGDLADFPGRPLIVTGHSLGASLAQEEGVVFEADEGYVFGSPRVGNSEFVAAVRFPLWRFEHRTDPVTFAPPRTSLRQIAHALVHGRLPTLYDRAGQVVLVDGHLHRMVHYRPSVTAYLDKLS